MEFLDFARKELERERDFLEQVSRRLEKCPPGYLQVKPHRDGQQFYHKIPGEPKPIYINSSQAALRNELACKRMLKETAARLKENIKGLESVIDVWRPFDYGAAAEALPKSYEQAFCRVEETGLWVPEQWGTLPGGPGTPVDDRGLVLGPEAGGYNADGKLIVGNWTDEKGRPVFRPSQNPRNRDHLIHSTTFGLKTRSKGEAMLAELLYSMGLPVLYEQELILRNWYGRFESKYPDFTFPFLAPVYLEHKGMMQDRGYAERDLRTTQLYHYNGIYPPKNLIITMDGPDGAFSGADMERMIRGLLLR